MTEACCETCRFFRGITPGMEDADGFCQRFPPKLFIFPDEEDGYTTYELESRWPFVCAYDWCGEYQPKEKV